MPNILDYYQYFQLATAAYIDLDKAPRTAGTYSGGTMNIRGQTTNSLGISVASP